MRPMKLGITVLAVLVVIVAIVFIGSGKRVKLIADDQIDVVDRAVADPSQTKTIAKLQPGQELPVLSCVDLKHYIVPEIGLSDGKRGYVLVGKFHLKREPFWSSLDSPITFSC
jgi:hypothetical protein